jgi:hypothetical protein
MVKNTTQDIFFRMAFSPGSIIEISSSASVEVLDLPFPLSVSVISACLDTWGLLMATQELANWGAAQVVPADPPAPRAEAGLYL